MSRILRGDLVPLDQQLSTEIRAVVCKEVLGYGKTGTGQEAKIAAEAYFNEHKCIVPYLGVTQLENESSNASSSAPETQAQKPPPVPKQWIVSLDLNLGNLSEWIRTNPVGLNELGLCDHLSSDVLSGLIHLHKMEIVHGDLKTDNIFVWLDNDLPVPKLRAKVADFGLARYSVVRRGDTLRTEPTIRRKGTAAFMAVEYLDKAPPMVGFVQDKAARLRGAGKAIPGTEQLSTDPLSKQKANDVWAFGMIQFHVYSGQPPFRNIPAHEEDQLRMELLAGYRPQYPARHAKERGMDFVRWRTARDCWQHIPSRRPEAADIRRIWEDVQLRQIDGCLQTPPFGSAGLHAIPDSEVDFVKDSAPPNKHSGYVEVKAHWRPSPNVPGYVPVLLIRPDNRSGPVNEDGWSTDFRHELCRWRQLQHEGLRPLLGVYLVQNAPLREWHAVVPVYDTFDQWSERTLRGDLDIVEPWYKMLLDVASALQFLHMQSPMIVHGAVELCNVLFPSFNNSQVETQFSVNATLANFRSVRTGDTTLHDVKAFGELALQVCSSHRRSQI
ncbi:kinase-like domain-containing protein [Auriculariales sp. MPI-PUGE-AT-0066]|nr:kinase-like domain-containing protein [Auriculariales sp. MPI-PUGE-AT-0066]